MDELIPTQQNDNGEILVTGRDLHEFLEVNSNYTTWMNRMIEYGFFDGLDFIPKMEESSGGRPSVNHHIKIDMAKEISMLQRTEKGKQARQYFIHVEKMWNSPEMIVKRAMEIQEQKIKHLEGQIKRDEPYTTFGKVVANSDASINIGAFAKLLYDKHSIRIGRNKLFAWMRDKGYLIKSGREKNNPKQLYLEQGLFDTSVTLISRTHGDVESVTTLVTGKGQVEIAKKLLKEFEVTA